MANKKIHVAIYRDGRFKVSTEWFDVDDSIRVIMTPLVEMTKKQQEEAVVFFEERMPRSSSDFKQCGVMGLGAVVLGLANEFISISGK